MCFSDGCLKAELNACGTGGNLARSSWDRSPLSMPRRGVSDLGIAWPRAALWWWDVQVIVPNLAWSESVLDTSAGGGIGPLSSHCNGMG